MATPIAKLDFLCDYIERNLKDALSLERLSEAGGLSAFQLIRLFERFAGIPPMAYVRARRLAGSVPQLLRGDSVLEVALDWGFEYEQSYIRAFRDAYGTTPARFRRRSAPVEITGPLKLSGFTVSANGLFGRPALTIRPAFSLAGDVALYNYQDNLLWGTPLLNGVKGHDGSAYTAVCRPCRAPHFEHEYLVESGGGGSKFSFPAGRWAHFAYSGLHPLDAEGATRMRLLSSLVIGNWYADNGYYWDGGFIETVPLDRCSKDYCEVNVSCFIEEVR